MSTVHEPLTIDAGPGDQIVFAPPAAPATFKMRHQEAPWDNAPAATYTDYVFAWGWNIGTAPGHKDNPAECYGAWHTESKFYPGPNAPSPFLEHFYTFIPAASDINYRPIAFVGTHDGTFMQLAFASNQIVMTLPGGVPQIDFDFRAAKQVNVYDGIKFNFMVNNVPVAYQRSAAGTQSYALPYLDDKDNIAVSRPITTPTINGVAAGPEFRTRGGNTSAARFSAPEALSAVTEWSCGTGSAKKTATAGVDAGNNFVLSQGGTGGVFFLDFNTTLKARVRGAGYAVPFEASKDAFKMLVPARLKDYSNNAKPSAAASGLGALIYVGDHPDGPLVAISTGQTWCKLAIVGAEI